MLACLGFMGLAKRNRGDSRERPALNPDARAHGVIDTVSNNAFSSFSDLSGLRAGSFFSPTIGLILQSFHLLTGYLGRSFFELPRLAVWFGISFNNVALFVSGSNPGHLAHHHNPCVRPASNHAGPFFGVSQW